MPDATVKVGDVEETIEGGLRPKNKKYLIIKPTQDGKRRIKEGYCACYELHENFLKLHGKNGVVVKVPGGEGDKYQALGSKKVPATEPGQEATWVPVFWSATVPPFKPPDYDSLVSEQYAESVVKDIEKEEDAKAIRDALQGDGARDVTAGVDMDEVANILSKRA